MAEGLLLEHHSAMHLGYHLARHLEHHWGHRRDWQMESLMVIHWGHCLANHWE